MTLFSKLRGTTEAYWKIGLSGPQLKDNLGVVEFRNSADGAFAIARGLDPVGDNDLVTKLYSDAASPNRVECETVAQADITLSGNQSINGVTTTTGMRVLLTAQAAGADNGIYLANSGAWTRALDMSTSAQCNRGVVVYIHTGARARSTWTLITTSAINLGTTSLTFEEGSAVFGTAVATTIGTASTTGGAPTTLRSDHVHAHGNQTLASLHAVSSTSGAGFLPQSNFSATTNPGVGNDSTQLYAIGSIWVNVTLDIVWVAVDVSVGAAIWKNAVASGDFSNGGDTTGGNRTLGNNDAFSLGIKTNNITRFLVNADGSIVTTNSTAASVALTVKGASAQSADLQWWADSAGAELTCIDSTGFMRIAGTDSAFPNSPVFIKKGPSNLYLQSVIQNSNAGNAASSDFVAVADNGSDTTFYVDLGINSSTYADAAYNISGINDSYLFNYGGHLVLAAATATKTIVFATGGTTTTQKRMTLSDTALVMSTLPIQGVVDPTNPQDAATKFYADAASPSRVQCRTLSKTSITLSGNQSVGGVSTTDGMRVLLTGQAPGSANGIYLANAGAWTRAADLSTSAQANRGVVVYVNDGAGTRTTWTLQNAAAITLGTTALSFEEGSVIFTTSTPSAVGVASIPGSAPTVARSDHTHAHGNQTSGVLHAVSSTSGAGFLPQSNFVATTNPGVADDVAHGYKVGSIWINVTLDLTWICVDESTGAAIWNSVASTGGSGGPLLRQLLFAPDFDDPGTDWSTTVPASLNVDGVNAALLIRRFDDTAAEGVGWSCLIPSGCTQVKFTFHSKGVTAPAATRTVGLALKAREVPDNSTLGAWISTTLTDISIPTNVTFQRDTQTLTLATLSYTADRIYQFELVRQNPAAGTELVGDWGLLMLQAEWLV